jgi:hypothetical protein
MKPSGRTLISANDVSGRKHYPFMELKTKAKQLRAVPQSDFRN